MEKIDGKIGKAATQYATMQDKYPGYDPAIRKAYIEGANWVMSLPLTYRLTEEERKKIKDMYWDALKEWVGVGDAREHCRAGIALENIFGIEMFKNK